MFSLILLITVPFVSVSVYTFNFLAKLRHINDNIDNYGVKNPEYRRRDKNYILAMYLSNGFKYI